MAINPFYSPLISRQKCGKESVAVCEFRGLCAEIRYSKPKRPSGVEPSPVMMPFAASAPMSSLSGRSGECRDLHQDTSRLRPRSLPVPMSTWSRAAARAVSVRRGRTKEFLPAGHAAERSQSSPTRKRISGLRPIVPVPVQGTSHRIRSYSGCSFIAVTSCTSRRMTLAYWREGSTHGLEPSLADIPGSDLRLWISLGQNRGLTAGSSAGVQDVGFRIRQAPPPAAILRPECGCDHLEIPGCALSRLHTTRLAAVRNSPCSSVMPSSVRSRSAFGSSKRIEISGRFLIESANCLCCLQPVSTAPIAPPSTLDAHKRRQSARRSPLFDSRIHAEAAPTCVGQH